MEPQQMRAKKVLSEEALANLARARQAAAKKRKEQGELTRLRKQAADKLIENEKKQLESVLSGVPKPSPVETPVVPPSPEPAPVLKIKKSKKKRPQIIIEESSSDDEDDEPVIYIRKPKAPKPIKEVLQEEPFEPEPPKYIPPPVPVQPVYQPRFHMPVNSWRMR